MKDLIIIGGGAAGLFLAANIKNRRVLLLESTKYLGKKMLLTGSGMCNLTNCDETEEFLTRFGGKSKANFLKPALTQLSTESLKQWFENRGLPLTIREDGKVFPSSLKARSVVDLLVQEAKKKGVEIMTDHPVTQVEKNGDQFTVTTAGKSYLSTSVALTTGGKSYESTGSDGSGFLLAKSLGHGLIEPTQALVSVIIEDSPFIELAGNAIRNSRVDFFHQGQTKRYLSAAGDLLFTHKGLSGPVILNNSRFIRSGDSLRVSLIPVENKEHSREKLQGLMLQDGNRHLRNLLKSLGLFSSLAEKLLNLLEIPFELPCSQLNKNKRKELIHLLLEFPLTVTRKGLFSSAMVTAGGVDLTQVNRQTMESRLTPGLYFAGEVLDIDGDTGGYNLQAAFSTAQLIAQSLEG